MGEHLEARIVSTPTDLQVVEVVPAAARSTPHGQLAPSGRTGAGRGGMATSDGLSAYERSDEDFFEQYLRERCARSRNTENSYRAVLRRFKYFCTSQGLASVREFTRTRWSDWQSYLRHPPPEHIMTVSVAHTHANWRPFRGPLGERSAAQSEIVVRAFFDWLSDPSVGGVVINPTQSIRTPTQRRSATRGSAGVERSLEDRELDYLIRALLEMPAETAEQRMKRSRARWVLTLAVNTGLRASELAAARRRDIVPNPKAETPGSYMLRVTRKGGVQAELPLHGSILVGWREYLSEYRRECRTPWSDDADLPLVLPLRRQNAQHMQCSSLKVCKAAGEAASSAQRCYAMSACKMAKIGASASVPSTTRATVWNVITDLAREAADLALKDGDLAMEERLRRISTHWMRHTFASNLLRDGAKLVNVRDLMDHASLTTTNEYVHNPAAELAAAVNLMRDRTREMTGNPAKKKFQTPKPANDAAFNA